MIVCKANIPGIGERLTVTSDNMQKAVLVNFDGEYKEFFTKDDASKADKITWSGWYGDTNPAHGLNQLSGTVHSKFKNVVKEIRSLK